MQFSVLERILLVQALPREGSFQNLKLLRECREALSFNEEENKELKMRTEGDQVFWESSAWYNKATGEKLSIAPEILEKDPQFIQRIVDRDPDAFELRELVGPKEVEIGEVVKKLIIESLRRMDTQEKLTEGHFTLYKRFVEAEEEKQEATA